MFPESQKEKNKLTKENLRLKSAAEELSILNEIATSLAFTQSLNQITSFIIIKYIKHLSSMRGLNQIAENEPTFILTKRTPGISDRHNSNSSIHFND